MLELKRKVQQTVKIGREAVLTIASLDRDSALIELLSPAMHLIHRLNGRHPVFETQIDGYLLRIHLLGVSRGEACLGFEADRTLPINRGEVA